MKLKERPTKLIVLGKINNVPFDQNQEFFFDKRGVLWEPELIPHMTLSFSSEGRVQQ